MRLVRVMLMHAVILFSQLTLSFRVQSSNRQFLFFPAAAALPQQSRSTGLHSPANSNLPPCPFSPFSTIYHAISLIAIPLISPSLLPEPAFNATPATSTTFSFTPIPSSLAGVTSVAIAGSGSLLEG